MKKALIIFITLCCILSAVSFPISAVEDVYVGREQLPFVDVRVDHWFYEPITFCYANGIVNGMSEDRFSPQSLLNKAQLVTLLANISGEDLSGYHIDELLDVKEGNWYYPYVAWAVTNGIAGISTNVAGGNANNKFLPNETLTRAQTCVIMHKFMEYQGDKVTVEEGILDRYNGTCPTWAKESMEYMVSSGIISGTGNGNLDYTGQLTRAQTCQILRVYLEKYLYADHEHSFSSTDCTERSVCTECGMTEGLAKGHYFASYDCAEGGVCSHCGLEMSFGEDGHDYVFMGCGKPMVCSVCGAKSADTPQHDYTDLVCNGPRVCKLCGGIWPVSAPHDCDPPTCTTASVCRTCGREIAKALGHTTTNGVCTRCNKDVFKSDFHKLTHYMLKNSTANGDGTYYILKETKAADKSTELYYIYYDAKEGRFDFSYGKTAPDGSPYLTFDLTLPRDAVFCEYSVYQYANYRKVCADWGMMNLKAYSYDTPFMMNTFSGQDSDYEAFSATLTKHIASALKGYDSIFHSFCDVGIEALGFTNAK